MELKFLISEKVFDPRRLLMEVGGNLNF